MFTMFYTANPNVSIGEIIPFGQIKVKVLEVKEIIYRSVDEKPGIELIVKKFI